MQGLLWAAAYDQGGNRDQWPNSGRLMGDAVRVHLVSNMTNKWSRGWRDVEPCKEIGIGVVCSTLSDFPRSLCQVAPEIGAKHEATLIRQGGGHRAVSPPSSWPGTSHQHEEGDVSANVNVQRFIELLRMRRFSDRNGWNIHHFLIFCPSLYPAGDWNHQYWMSWRHCYLP